MHQRYRVKGIFIKKQDQGEADQLLTVFTEQFGKIIVVDKFYLTRFLRYAIIKLLKPPALLS